MATPKRRADAERNRDRVLTAARRLLAERGDEVQLPEIARAAGVGVGTVYRHFPTRRDLIEAAADTRFAEIARFAREDCLGRPAALARYLRHVGEVLDSDRGLSAAVENVRGTAGSAPRDAARADLEAVVAELLAQSRAEGEVRDDCTIGDVYLLAGCLSSVIRTGSGDWRRFLDLAFDGLRPRLSAPE
ncbi:TetR/AcrR family transcriptional regulator [Amycolatopsis endophytica]|uniref:AcrR family transcriptional regulator n=1 Tax=Amycolatopsis endophytica TaxID=860233 RepID=A0A853B7N6_9PSEU|nr:TetR/AcrR family transcriptional regulator [Amycolatopsis endophytica]NYI91010.1 AcrR family transcriptional regulator [Amycolatopsis endophytica]